MKNVTFLGVEGSGKTVLTTALANIFREHEKDGWYLRPDSRESFRFLEQAPASLEAGSMPHQTTSLKRLAWSVQLNRETIRTFDVLDYPGEIYRLAFLEAKDDSDPSSFAQRVAANKEDIDAVLSHLMESDQVFVLFNLADSTDLSKNGANLDAVWVTNACLDYLHRLPNRPTITLLLTQIDRYADLSKYELDPDVYVAHHLPLIHRNFPNLDVLAVSAVGPANATFGIDSIILRCLFECEAIQKIVTSLKDNSRQVYDWLGKMSLNSMTTTSASYVETKIEACRNLTAKLPWFIPLGQLSDNGFCVDFDEMSDMASIVKVLKSIDMSRCPEERISSIDSGRKHLAEFETTSEAGMKFKTKFVSEIENSFDECKRQIANRIVVRKRCNIAIVILAILAAAEIAYVFWRAMF